MFFMACSPQPTVEVDTNYWSGDARLDQEGRSGATPPTLSCHCRLAGRFRCFSFDIHRYGQATSPMRCGYRAGFAAPDFVGRAHRRHHLALFELLKMIIGHRALPRTMARTPPLCRTIWPRWASSSC